MTPEILLAAYSQGLFPMADSANSDDVHWYCPEQRGQLSISQMHIPRRLQKSVRQMKIAGAPYEIHINRNFRAVIQSCAQINQSRNETWINRKIIDAYCDLHESGHAHSVETWQGKNLIGGLYGVSIGAAFFGESMFSCARDASKVALVHLVVRLHHAGFQILDTQFTNDHLEQFGVYELGYKKYLTRLKPALDLQCYFDFKAPNERALVSAYLSGR
ncbi:MAG: leucyl/phenylalanyl-tRNA--protein transferase [Alphaproteobacteria bacterium]